MSCKHCENMELPVKGVAHEFIILKDKIGAGIYYYDSDHGWEGTEINYCPWCGETLSKDATPYNYVGEVFSSRNEAPKTRADILDAAKQCVCTDRDQQYGSPEDNFKTIAKMWSAYFTAKFGHEVEIDPHDVAVAMSMLKIARIATGKPKADNWIDGTGYLACGGEIQARNSH